jgi:hypothetical protein
MDLYVLAAKLEIEDLKNAATNALYDYIFPTLTYQRCPDMTDIQYIFEMTKEGSQIRGLVITAALFYIRSRGNLPNT